MAQQGVYRDPPSRRMAYDADGSIGFRLLNGNLTQWTQGFMEDLNGEAYVATYHNNAFDPYGYFIVIFPELRDITHSYRNLANATYAPSSHSKAWQVSSNTTNGQDGDWVSMSVFTARIESTVPNFRENMGIVGANNVNAIRWLDNTSHAFNRPRFCQWHIYGHKSSSQTPHRIDFCDQNGNELLIDNDFGDQPRNSERVWGTTDTWNQASALYVKNRSTTKQASNVNLSIQVVNNSSDFHNFLRLSDDGITYSLDLNFASINPQEIVGPIYVSHDPDISASLSVKAARVKLSVGSWS